MKSLMKVIKKINQMIKLIKMNQTEVIANQKIEVIRSYPMIQKKIKLRKTLSNNKQKMINLRIYKRNQFCMI
jgi:hypothetical protein